MAPYEVATLTRDCEVTRIPYGDKMSLAKGTKVEITQSLGGTYTLMTEEGSLVSISGKDADALGKTSETSETQKAKDDSKPLSEKVWGQLRKCFDPEIPHNIVDLGLIYEVKIDDKPEGQKGVYVKMTLTAPGCGMGDWLKNDVAEKVQSLPEIKDVHVDMVFEPAWNQDMINPKLKPYLGM